jgi:hypothetical protein
VQGASWDRSASATRSLPRQCAPGTVPHAGSVVASIRGGPSCGHFGAGAAASPLAPPTQTLPRSQAPVGFLSMGETHGAQRSSSAQESLGKTEAYASTSGRHTLMHTPSAPLSEAHLLGTCAGFSRRTSGTHTPVAHFERRGAR